ncbi:MAG: hypothetical protein LBN05_07240 [Oscillospiraceae bacterium]|jgi:hypothetical protein|nr:hypothetical protein [Oscillospiraceae bacterium]
MKKSTKKSLRVLAILLAVLLGSGVGFYTFRQFVSPKTVLYSHADFMRLSTDLREIVATSPYVFVGRVEKTYDVQTTKLYRKAPPSIRAYMETGSSFTECIVQVVRNIKGELPMDEPITFYKSGGVTSDLLMVSLAEGDILPEAEKLYLFIPIADKDDGSLRGGRLESTWPLEEDITEETLDQSKIVQTYQDAFDHSYLSTKTKGLMKDGAFTKTNVSIFDERYDDTADHKIAVGTLPEAPPVESGISAQKYNILELLEEVEERLEEEGN